MKLLTRIALAGVLPATALFAFGLSAQSSRLPIRTGASPGHGAKVTFRLSKDIKLWTSATVFKKATSLLGENYLEVDPGEPLRAGPDGAKAAFTPLGAECMDYDSPDETQWYRAGGTALDISSANRPAASCSCCPKACGSVA